MNKKTTLRDIQSYIKLILWTLIIAYLCFTSGSGINDLKITSLIPAWILPYMDKIVHFIMFFTLAFLVKSLESQATISRKNYYVLVVACVVYGLLTEIIQHYLIVSRSGDIVDFISDVIGISVSLSIFRYWPKWIKWIFG